MNQAKIIFRPLTPTPTPPPPRE